MILEYSDLTTYAPNLVVTEEEILPQLYYVQMLIENEANRNLEVTEYIEKLPLSSKFQNCQLTFSPIINPPVPVVQARLANVETTLYQGYPPTDWLTIDPANYLIDSDRMLSLKGGISSESIYLPVAAYHAHRQYFTEVQVTYSAGIDFSLATQEVKIIKSAAASLLNYIRSVQFQGVEMIQVPFDEFRVKFTAGIMPGVVPKELTAMFRAYRCEAWVL